MTITTTSNSGTISVKKSGWPGSYLDEPVWILPSTTPADDRGQGFQRWTRATEKSAVLKAEAPVFADSQEEAIRILEERYPSDDGMSKVADGNDQSILVFNDPNLVTDNLETIAKLVKKHRKIKIDWVTREKLMKAATSLSVNLYTPISDYVLIGNNCLIKDANGSSGLTYYKQRNWVIVEDECLTNRILAARKAATTKHKKTCAKRAKDEEYLEKRQEVLEKLVEYVQVLRELVMKKLPVGLPVLYVSEDARDPLQWVKPTTKLYNKNKHRRVKGFNKLITELAKFAKHPLWPLHDKAESFVKAELTARKFFEKRKTKNNANG